MPVQYETQPDGDAALVDLLRREESLTVSALADRMGVTNTAVRQRLSRLLAAGQVEREISRQGRGRPSHRYQLTASGRRRAGSNLADLAHAIWREIQDLPPGPLRTRLIQGVAGQLAAQYAAEVEGETIQSRMESLVDLFQRRRMPFSVDLDGQLPVLKAYDCPYPGMADDDHAICEMERTMLGQVLGEELALSECRASGGRCCTFHPAETDRKEAE